jgi:phosphoribosyl 1,2-cyclic phosphodiesterase
MATRITVLGSGSSGNATLVQAEGRGLLIDCGFGPRDLGRRFQSVGLSWSNVNAVLLTHTHGDHWNRFTLEHLRRLKLPLIAHALQHDSLGACDEYQSLKKASLVHDYGASPFNLGGILRVQPIEVPHDSAPTFAFRIGQTLPDGRSWSYGHASDLGCIPDELLERFRGIDVLALEFNHCAKLERASRRPRHLVQRVLSDLGHLSNDQAGEVLKAWVEAGEIQAVIALHLSRECNTPELALTAARAAAPDSEIHAATQATPTPTIIVEPRVPRVTSPSNPILPSRVHQPTLLDLADGKAG